MYNSGIAGERTYKYPATFRDEVYSIPDKQHSGQDHCQHYHRHLYHQHQQPQHQSQQLPYQNQIPQMDNMMNQSCNIDSQYRYMRDLIQEDCEWTNIQTVIRSTFRMMNDTIMRQQHQIKSQAHEIQKMHQTLKTVQEMVTEVMSFCHLVPLKGLTTNATFCRRHHFLARWQG